MISPRGGGNIRTMTFLELLSGEYGLRGCDVSVQQGGWSALAYRVRTPHTSYFLKIYQKSRASTPALTAHLDDYLSVLAKLDDGRLRGRVVEPVRTLNGLYKCEDGENIYVLFKYVEGYVLEDRDLTNIQIDSLAKIVADLHNAAIDVRGVSGALPVEDFTAPFCGKLRRFLDEELPSCDEEIKRLLSPIYGQLKNKMAEMGNLAHLLRTTPPDFVLCHTDIHGWNLMQGSESLVLLDWEGMKFAPAEADLFLFADKPYRNRLMSAYAQRRPEYLASADAMSFYIVRRRLEDIWEFLEQLTVDKIGEGERKAALTHLAAECKML